MKTNYQYVYILHIMLRVACKQTILKGRKIMPFPSFSDIDSLINIDKEDAIDLLLSSIALEEKCLSI